MRRLLLAAALAVVACSPPRMDAGAGLYDGSTAAGFAAFAASQSQEWPTPVEIGTFKAPDEAPLRYARWTPLGGGRAGTVVFFQGRTEFIEKNIYTYKDLLADGYDVWTLDWRGQGLSSRPLGTTDKGDIDSYKTFVGDAERFIDGVVKLRDRPGPKILLAHSMGGGIGTLYLLRHPDQFDRAIFSSPLVRLPWKEDNAAVWLANKVKVAAGLGRTCAGLNPFSCSWGSNFRSGKEHDPCSFRGAAPREDDLDEPKNTQRYTHDFAKVALIDCMVLSSQDPAGSTPGLAVGGSTSKWLRATFLATDEIVAADPMRLKTPLLIIGAGGETVVSNEAQKAFCGPENPSCCRLEIDGAGHEILVETEDKRREFLDYFRRFVATKQTPKQFCEAARQRIAAKG